jgi:hypothetical protein
MMFRLKTGWVDGYSEGQEPLIYLVSTAQAVAASSVGFVFSDGHGLAAVGLTQWFDGLVDLDKVDWSMVGERYWTDNDNDMDRQRRKQAEFLVYRFCDWSLIHEIAVIDAKRKRAVEDVFARFPADLHRPVDVRPDWYYY